MLTKREIESSKVKPSPLPVIAENIPIALRQLDQWVGWRYLNVDGRWTIPPFNIRTGRKASHSNPADWVSFPEAIVAYREGRYDGVGFVFAVTDPFVRIDLDDALDPETEELNPAAAAVVRVLDTYAEVSPSRTGVKLFAVGTLKESIKRPKIELYDRKRFFCATGCPLSGAPSEPQPRQAVIDALVKLLPKTNGDDGKPPPRVPCSAADEAILSKAMKSPKFQRLWNGDTSGHGNNHTFDPSSDKITDLCEQFTAKLKTRGNSGGTNTTMNLVTSPTAVTPTNSWLDFRSYLYFDERNKIVQHKPLTGAAYELAANAAKNALVGNNPKPYVTAPAAAISGVTGAVSDIVQKLGTGRKLYFTGTAKRVGYQIPVPEVTSYGNVPVIEKHRAVKLEAISSVGGFPIWKLDWFMEYVMTESPKQRSSPANIDVGVVGAIGGGLATAR